VDFAFDGPGRPGQNEGGGYGSSVMPNPVRHAHERRQAAGGRIREPPVQRPQVAVTNESAEPLHQGVGARELGIFSQHSGQYLVLDLVQLLGRAKAQPAYSEASLTPPLRWTAATCGRLGRIAPGTHRLDEQGPTGPASLCDELPMELAGAVAALLPASLKVRHEGLE
jgi:hypothetical protein